jgi:hypothetical protein
LVFGIVSEHGPENVEASAGQCDDGLGMAFAFGSFSLVVSLGGWAPADAGEGGEVKGTQQAAIVATGAAQVTAKTAGVSWDWGETGNSGEPVGLTELRDIAVGGGEEFGAEQGTESGQAQDDLGLAMLTKPVLDEGVQLGDLVVEGEYRVGESGDHLGCELLARHCGVLGAADPNRFWGRSTSHKTVRMISDAMSADASKIPKSGRELSPEQAAAAAMVAQARERGVDLTDGSIAETVHQESWKQRC